MKIFNDKCSVLPGRVEHDEVWSNRDGIIEHLHRVCVFGVLILFRVIITTYPAT